MEINGFKYQYIINPKKGDTVSYGNGTYRVHDDGRGWLHIIVQENNVRKKIGIEKVIDSGIEPGSEADYVLNESWFNPLYFILNDLIKDETIRTILVYGGKSSAKTFSISQLLSKECLINNASTIAFRKESTTIPTALKESFNKAVEII